MFGLAVRVASSFAVLHQQEAYAHLASATRPFDRHAG
jgi:hypothetical protein